MPNTAPISPSPAFRMMPSSRQRTASFTNRRTIRSASTSADRPFAESDVSVGGGYCRNIHQRCAALRTKLNKHRQTYRFICMIASTNDSNGHSQKQRPGSLTEFREDGHCFLVDRLLTLHVLPLCVLSVLVDALPSLFAQQASINKCLHRVQVSALQKQQRHTSVTHYRHTECGSDHSKLQAKRKNIPIRETGNQTLPNVLNTIYAR